MPDITNAEAIRWTNEVVRPLAEQMRGLKARIDSALCACTGVRSPSALASPQGAPQAPQNWAPGLVIDLPHAGQTRAAVGAAPRSTVAPTLPVACAGSRFAPQTPQNLASSLTGLPH